MRLMIKQVIPVIPRRSHDELHVLEMAIEKVNDYEKVLRIIESKRRARANIPPLPITECISPWNFGGPEAL